MSDLEVLKSMLSFCRPAHSKTEAEYIARFIEPLGTQTDKFGNRYLTIGEERPSILWSSHTDSVHSKPGYQRIQVTGNKIHLPKKTNSSCLGADDAAGNWIMIEMIKAKVPGLYVFHAAEEIGCKGSGGIANETPKFLDGIKAAIAFDRRGCTSVITVQRSRTASDVFARSVADQLPFGFKPDPTGVLTDTKIYMGIVPECSNISVGYESEHTVQETLDFQHLFELRDYMLKIDASKFVIERDPKVVSMPKTKHYNSGGSMRSSLGDGGGFGMGRLLRDMRLRDLQELVWKYPRQVAQFLDAMNVSVDELDDAIHFDTRRRPASLFDDEDQSLIA
jgi:hypothetical protein